MDVERTCEVALREPSDADVVHGAGGVATPVRGFGHLESAHLNANLATKPAPNAVWRQIPQQQGREWRLAQSYARMGLYFSQ